MTTTMHSDQNGSPLRVEVITSVQRRRRWPTAETPFAHQAGLFAR